MRSSPGQFPAVRDSSHHSSMTAERPETLTFITTTPFAARTRAAARPRGSSLRSPRVLHLVRDHLIARSAVPAHRCGTLPPAEGHNQRLAAPLVPDPSRAAGSYVVGAVPLRPAGPCSVLAHLVPDGVVLVPSVVE